MSEILESSIVQKKLKEYRMIMWIKEVLGKFLCRNQRAFERNQLWLSQIYGFPPMYVNSIVDESSVKKAFLKLRPAGCYVPLKRVGSKNDGGYILPDLNYEKGTLLSAGISDNCDFETELATAGMLVHMLDGSITAPPTEHPSFIFQSQFLAPISSAPLYISFEDWLEQADEIDVESRNVLKLDIEGSEWRVLTELTESQLLSFSVIVVELHWIENFMDAWSLEVMSRALDLLGSKFDIVNLHPNNFAGYFRVGEIEIPRVVEVSYLRRDLNRGSLHANSSFPNLNEPNDIESEELELPNWNLLETVSSEPINSKD